MKICIIDGCERKLKAKGYCDLHYYRYRVNGNPLTFKERYAVKKITKEEFFWLNIKKTDTCWIWEGNKNKDGYGRINFNSKHQLAHRYAYELLVGCIPENKLICHHCDNPPCCNPEHLFLGTDRQNTDDKLLKKRHKNGQKLSITSVKEIKKLLNNGLTQKKIGEIYGVTRSAISNIAYGQSWSNIE